MRTKKGLLAHQLAAQLQDCDSPSGALAVLQLQVQVFDQSRNYMAMARGPSHAMIVNYWRPIAKWQWPSHWMPI